MSSPTLRERIEEAKRRLPLPQLLAKIGDGDHAKKSTRCPFHEDRRASFSVFQKDGMWFWKCHAGCGHGDGVDYLKKRFALATKHAIGRYCSEAGLSNGAATPAKRSESFDWQQSLAAMTADAKSELAAWRGLSPDFVDWLHRKKVVGIHMGHIAFAVHKAGRVVGCHYLADRSIKLWKYFPAGNGTQPLIFGDPGSAVYVSCFESQWDAFAVMDNLGWHSNAPPDTAVLITRGSDNGKLIKGQCSPGTIVYAFVQNDTAKPDAKIPAEMWLATVAATAGCKVLRVTTPAPHKDANDWIRAGATLQDIEGAIRAAKAVAAPEFVPPPKTDTAPNAKPEPSSAKLLLALTRSDPDDCNELLRRRFLCRGAGMLFVAPTGVGKSVWAMQAMILWALGREAFGIVPARPLKSLLVQAENDDGDLAEMRDGIIAGMRLTEADAKTACEKIVVVREDEKLSFAFFGFLRQLLAEHKPDLLWIDPALAYLGGESNAQKDVGAFLRNGLNPLLREFNCGGIVIHHSNKPPSGREKPLWAAGDFAYLGAGSAEWANWARAVLALRSVGSHEIYELRVGKRGGRLDWRNEDGTKSYVRYIAHAKEPGVICWREAGPEEIQPTGGRPKADAAELLALLPPEGLATGEWVKLAKTECGVSGATLHRVRRAMLKDGRIAKSSTSGKWQPVLKQ
jgi:hypothetical protein